VTTAAETHTPSRACYQRGCRDAECVAVNYRYEKGVSYDVSHGRRRQIDSRQVRTHIEQLRAHGWSRLRISRVARVSRSAVYNLAAGQTEVRRHVALAILSIRIGPPQINLSVDAAGTTRRIQALVAIGHTMESIASLAHYSHSKIEGLAAGQAESVSVVTANTVTAIYRQLLHKPGPSRQARAFARKRGWHGPLAWDDIDNPEATPEVAPSYADAPKYERDPDRAREMVHLHLLGESIPHIAKKIGTTEKYVADQLPVALRQRAWRIKREAEEQRRQQAAATPEAVAA
jgi:AraC-like DNA-binding protein